jgi:hypothetical protein
MYSGQTSPSKSAHKTQSANGSIIAWARKNNTLPIKIERTSASSLFASAAAANARSALNKGMILLFMIFPQETAVVEISKLGAKTDVKGAWRFMERRQ